MTKLMMEFDSIITKVIMQTNIRSTNSNLALFCRSASGFVNGMESSAGNSTTGFTGIKSSTGTGSGSNVLLVLILVFGLFLQGCQGSANNDNTNNDSASLSAGDTIVLSTADGGTINGTLVDQGSDGSLDGVDLDSNTNTLELAFVESGNAATNRTGNTTTSTGTAFAIDVTDDGVVDFYLRILDVSTGVVELNLQEDGSGTVVTLILDDDGIISGVDTDDDGQSDITITIVLSDNSNAITAFYFLATDNAELSEDVVGLIEGVGKTVSVTVPSDTDVSALIPTISITGFSISPVSGIATDFTNPVIYTLTAEDDTTCDYTVSVTKESSENTNSLIAFSFLAIDNSGLSADIAGFIDGIGGKVNVLVPSETDVTGLVPTIVMSGSSISPASGIATDFTSPVIYTITAEDGTTRDYTVTVIVAAPDSDKAITAFSFLKADNPGLKLNITGEITDSTITVEVPYGIDLTDLVATFSTTGEFVTVDGTKQVSGDVSNDFGTPLIYKVVTVDLTTREYTVNVSESSRHLEPLADPGPDVNGYMGFVTTLDGSASSDPYGYPLSYNWSITSVPSGSNVTLSDPTAINPSFLPDKYGDYEFSLVVNTNVTISVSNPISVSAGVHPTITGDPTTRLIWQDNSYSVQHDRSGAENYCNNLELEGYTDWRLPTAGEFSDIVSRAYLLKQVFDTCVYSCQKYWTGSYWPNSTAPMAFNFAYNNGFVSASTIPYYVRCVSDAQK